MSRLLTTRSTPKTLAEQYRKIRPRLLTLVRAERRVFYPACHDRLEDLFVIAHVSADLDRIEELVCDLDRGVAGSPQWMRQLAALRDTVDTHLEEERAVLFPRCERAFDDAELRSLDRAYRTVRAELIDALHGERPWYDRPARAATPTTPVRRSA